MENHKAIGFLSITGSDPLKITKCNAGPSLTRQRNTIKWRFVNGPIMACFRDILKSLPLTNNNKKNNNLKKNLVRVGI